MGVIVALQYLIGFIFPLLQAGPGEAPPNPAPITGGILLLIAGAIGYGIKTFFGKNKK